MNAINSLWNWNREIAVNVEVHVSLIDRVNRERLEAIEARDTALKAMDLETYNKTGFKIDSLNEQLANFGLELVALLKLESTTEANGEPTQPDEPTSKPLSSGDYPRPRAYALMNPTRDYFDHLEAWRFKKAQAKASKESAGNEKKVQLS